MTSARLIVLLAATAVLAGCASVTETNPARTATDMLLVNRAADRAVEEMANRVIEALQGRPDVLEV